MSNQITLLFDVILLSGVTVENKITIDFDSPEDIKPKITHFMQSIIQQALSPESEMAYVAFGMNIFAVGAIAGLSFEKADKQIQDYFLEVTNDRSRS